MKLAHVPIKLINLSEISGELKSNIDFHARDNWRKILFN